MNKNQIIRTFVQFKTRAGRGQSWLSNFSLLFILLGIANFESLKNNNSLAYIYFFLYGFSCYCIGFLDEKYGVWIEELRYGNFELNPINQNIIHKIDSLRREIQEMKK